MSEAFDSANFFMNEEIENKIYSQHKSKNYQQKSKKTNY